MQWHTLGVFIQMQTLTKIY